MSRRMLIGARRRALVATGGMVIYAGHAAAGTVAWTNAFGGIWQAGANWSSGSAPGAADDVVFDLGSVYTAALIAPASVNSLRMDDDEVVFDLGGHTLSLLSASDPLVVMPDADGAATMTFQNGTLSTPNAALVFNQTPGFDEDTRHFNLTFDNASWAFGGNVLTGLDFVGPTLHLNVVNGSQVAVQDLLADTRPVVRVSDKGSSLTFDDLGPRFLDFGRASLIVENGAQAFGGTIDVTTLEITGGGSTVTTSGTVFIEPPFAGNFADPVLNVTGGASLAIGGDLGVFGVFDESAIASINIAGVGTTVTTDFFLLGSGQGVISDHARMESGDAVLNGLGTAAQMTVRSNAVWESAGQIRLDEGVLSVYDGGRIVADSVLGNHAFDCGIGGDGIIEADVFAGDSVFLIVPDTLGRGSQGGELAITGDLTLNATSRVQLDIFSAAEADALLVEGSIAAAGEILVFLHEDYVPAVGDFFPLVKADAFTGEFGAITLPSLEAPFAWALAQSATEIRATVVPAPASATALGGMLWGAARRRRRG